MHRSIGNRFQSLSIPVERRSSPLQRIHHTGTGTVTIDAAKSSEHAPLGVAGASSNTYTGATHLQCGVLKLDKSGGAVAIPGDLMLGGSEKRNEGDGIIWGGDGQVSDRTKITLGGTQPSFLDLAGHKVNANMVTLGAAAKIRAGGGTLNVRQIIYDGKNQPRCLASAAAAMAGGAGTVTIDPRVDVKKAFTAIR